MGWANRVISGFTRPGYPQQWGLTAFAERAVESPSFSFGEQRDNAQRQYYIPWINSSSGAVAAVWQAAKDFLGYTTVQTAPSDVRGTVSRYLNRLIPHPLPSTSLQPQRQVGTLADGFTAWQFAKDITRIDVSREAGVDGARVGQGREALMTVVYSAFPYNIFTDKLLSDTVAAYSLLTSDDPTAAPMRGSSLAGGFPDEALMTRYIYSYFEPGGRFQAFKGFSTVNFDRDLAPLVWEENVLLNDGDLFVTWYQVPTEAVPMTAIQNCIGKTNRFAFNLGLGTGIGSGPSALGVIPPGKLICAVPKFDKPYRMVNGAFATNINYRFKWKPFGANFFYRPNPPKGVSGTWSAVTSPGLFAQQVNQQNVAVTIDSTAKVKDMDWIEFRDDTNNPATGRPFDDGMGYGSYQIHILVGGPANTVELLNTSLQTMPATFQNRAGATGTWILGPGWYSASRFGVGGANFQILPVLPAVVNGAQLGGQIAIGNPRNAKGQLFPPVDYSDLFRPQQ